MKRYECTLCHRIHYINGSVFMEHIRYKSAFGVWDAPPPPPIVLEPLTMDGLPIDEEKS